MHAILTQYYSFSDPVHMDNMDRYESREQILAAVNQKMGKGHEPLLIFLILTMVIGIVGNIHTILIYWFYYRKNSIRNYVLLVSCCDLAMIIIVTPLVLVYKFRTLTTPSNIFCKSYFTLAPFFSTLSLTTLDMIAIDRLRHIVKPFGKQITVVQSYYLCVGCCVYSLILAAPNAVLNHHTTIEKYFEDYNRTLLVDVCSNLAWYSTAWEMFDNVHYMIVSVMNIFYIALCFVSYIILSIYLCIARSSLGKETNRHHYNRHCQAHAHRARTPERRLLQHNHTRASPYRRESAAYFKSVHRSATPSTKRQNRFRTGIRTTLTFMVASVLSCTLYIPIVLVDGLFTYDEESFLALKAYFREYFDFMLFSNFPNFVLNPVVYLLIDAKFVRRLRMLYSRARLPHL